MPSYHELEKHDAIANNRSIMLMPRSNLLKAVDLLKPMFKVYRPTKIYHHWSSVWWYYRIPGQMGASVSTGQTLLIQFPPDDLWGWFCFDQKYLPRFALLQQKRTSPMTHFRLHYRITEYGSFGHIAFITGLLTLKQHHQSKTGINNKQNLLRSGMTLISGP